MIAGACYEGGQNALNQAVAGKLFPEKQLRSITRLEQFASCAYCHFMQYGLALVPREIHQVEATDIGTLFHNALEYISREMEQGTYGWRTLTDEERKQLVNAAVEQTLEEFDNTAIDSSARNQYMKNRLLRVTDRTVWALSQQIKQGEFEPAYYEFQTEKGRVDRIDLYETNDAVYVKIIDYKSGLKQFRLLDAYYGLQMQLVWYLADTIEALKKQYPGKEVRPGAIFYYHIQDPYVDLDAQDYLKQFAMSGLVNSRVEVIESLDTQLAQKRTSSVIPVSYTKANAPDSRSKIATEEQFADLEAYVKNEAQQMHAQIRGGMIAKNPYKRSNQSPCDYCDYKNVCGFDTRLPGFTYRQLPNMKQEVLWENFKKGAFENGMDEKPEEGN
jgi:ATP-dependent helicase/nuclease subunit B